ncbi:MAG: hypothetical protein ACI9VN_002793, partial [Patescibacteria group bacterium]
SFPVQLVMLHLRNNLLLILCWLVIGLLMTGTVGKLFGVHFLFLAPEYLGEVNIISFLFLGLAFGGFFISWNMTTYMLDAHHFPFLACLARPFTKFCLNNFIIPLVFLIFYFYYSIHFQWYFEFWSAETIIYNMLGFLAGFITVVLLSSIYFQFTNKDVFNLLKTRQKVTPKRIKVLSSGKREKELSRFRTGESNWRVETYLTESLKPRLVRSVDHYDDALLLSVFKQNHLNALIVQLFSLVVLLTLGCLIDNPWFRIPAGASVLVMCSVLVSITGAIVYWFNRWSLSIFVLLLVGINFLTSYDAFNHKNKGYGLDYTNEPAAYSSSSLEKICHPDTVQKDITNTLQILTTWRSKFEEKPKMAIFCVSGGGMKASVWAMQVLQQADSLMQGKLLDHTALITGASGGMIGMAYMRELLLQKKLGKEVDFYSRTHIDKISKDLLNSLAFTIVSNDLFLPWMEFTSGSYTYRKDRGYIFEKQLNINTDNLLNKRLGDYRPYEKSAAIPMMMITPSIVNDGRRLIMSPHGVSYMMKAPIGIRRKNTVEIDAVDYGRLFSQQNAYNIEFTSALRMNATYPYILPNVYLPSKPNIEVMDAGFRDNFGMLSATRFIHIFKNWIKENTSGVVLIQVRGSDKPDEITPKDGEGMIESLLNPLGIAGQILELQDYEHGNNIGFLFDMLGEDLFDIIRFTYQPNQMNQRASMTFHLTTREKNDIMSAYYLDQNQESLGRLVDYMGTETKVLGEVKE